MSSRTSGAVREMDDAPTSVQLNVRHFDAKIVVFISCVVSSYFSYVNMIACII